MCTNNKHICELASISDIRYTQGYKAGYNKALQDMGKVLLAGFIGFVLYILMVGLALW